MDQKPTPPSEVTHEDTAVHHHKPVDTREHSDVWRFGAELIRTALVVSILAIAIRTFAVQPFVVEGSSMFPRFETNDFLIVDKISYRFHTPERGDIIVFKYPYDLATNYVKRVIGLPGETVKIQDGKVIIINVAHPDGFTIDEPYLSEGNTTTLSVTSATNQFVVPDGKYFVLGDNRRASSDSREWGFLPKEDIIGRVFVQAYPFNRASWVSHASYSPDSETAPQ
jgi:signal peptidase I